MKNTKALSFRTIFLALVVSLVTVYFWLDSSSEAPPLTVEVHSASARETTESPPPAEPMRVQPSDKEVRTVLEITPDAVEDVAAPVAEELLRDDWLVLSGTVLLTSAAGIEVHDVSGELTLVLWVAEKDLGVRGRHLKLPIVGGAFRAVLKPTETGYVDPAGRGAGFEPEVRGASIGVSTLVLNDTDAAVVLLDPGERFAFGDELVVIRVREVFSVILHVEDQETGMSLGDLTLIQSLDWLSDGCKHPGRADAGKVLAKQALSPIEIKPSRLQASRGNQVCFVHSPGHAWAAIEIDFASGGERRVRLARGGDLEVLFSSKVEQAGAMLRMRSRVEPSPHLEVAVTGKESVLIEGLVPGEYDLGIEVGDWWAKPVVLASEGVELFADNRTQVQLVLDELPLLPSARLSGLVIVPEAWGITSFYLAFELLDTPLDGSDGRNVVYMGDLELVEPGTYAWDLGQVQVGTHKLTFSAAEYSILVELGPVGRYDVVLEIPPPVDVAVFIRDEVTGESADVQYLLWNCKRPAGVSGGGMERAVRALDSDWFRLRVPDNTEVEVSIMNQEYLDIRESFLAEEGLEVILETRKAGSVLVELRDGSVPIPWPQDDYGDVEHLDGEGQMGVSGRSGTGLWFTVSGPGLYRVQIPKVPGFENHEPVDVDVVGGEKTVVVVSLTRIP